MFVLQQKIHLNNLIYQLSNHQEYFNENDKYSLVCLLKGMVVYSCHHNQVIYVYQSFYIIYYFIYLYFIFIYLFINIISLGSVSSGDDEPFSNASFNDNNIPIYHVIMRKVYFNKICRFCEIK